MGTERKPRTFRELQSRCGDLSPTIINRRIKDLSSAKLISKIADTCYTLSDSGKELVKLFYPVNIFVRRWTKTLSSDDAT